MAKGTKKSSKLLDTSKNKGIDDDVDFNQFCVAATCGEWLLYKQRKPEPTYTFMSNPFQPLYLDLREELRKKADRKRIKNGEKRLFACFLWNPNSRKKINLPDLRGLCRYGKCIITAPPTSSECSILFLLKRRDRKFLFFCRPGDTYWGKKNYAGRDWFQDAIIYREKIYVVNSSQFCEVVINHDSKELRLLNNYDGAVLPQISPLSKEYLIESCGALLVVQRKSLFDVAVFEMDFEQRRWKRVSSIGDDKILFLIGNHSTLYSTEELGMIGSGNTIVFTVEDDEQTLYSFSLGDRCLSQFRNNPSNNIWVSHDELISTLSVSEKLPRYDIHEQILDESHDEDKTIGESTRIVDYKYNEYKYNDEDQSESTWFCRLTLDAQKLIYQHYLSSVYECMNFQRVCKAWRSLLHPIRWKPNPTGAAMKYPWLMFPRGKGIYGLYDPIGNLMHSIPDKLEQGCEVRYSNQGWLLVTKAPTTIFFYEPFTGERIDLPNLIDEYACIDGFFFTNAPTSPNWQIFGINHIATGYAEIVQLQSGEDQNWTSHHIRSKFLSESSYTNPVFDGQYFWYLGKNGGLVSFELEDIGFNLHEEIEPSSSLSGYSRGYLVCHENELLSVFLGQMGKSVHLFKLDRKKHNWVRIKRLEKKILYLSKTTCLVVEDMEQRKSETIQFSMFSDVVHGNGGNISYSLKTEQYHDDVQVYSSVSDLYDTKEFLTGTWIQPLVVPERPTV
ncbi:hypothetical protein COLO4_30702 [Corchorus olitorius]|uniref:KIB1-4 beta-propeller domain-containing protein n=1 Tax=Corchorus olitorius TaxID=93759 RepID=A0A1R3H7I6_9ROSI|nr:hypothetical protein COLO4_30702 [Corchorus olitorius]